MDKAKNLYMDRFGFIEKNTLGKIYSTPSTVYVCLHFCGLTACGISVLPPEMNSHPLYWKCWVLTMTAVVQSLSCVQLFATPWTEVHQASLSFTISQSLLKLMSIELVMQSNHLILYCSFLLLSSIFPSIRVFSKESALCIRWPKFWSFSCSISPPNEYSGLISFRIDWFDLLAVPGTVKNLLQHHNSKASILCHSAFFMVQLSHPYMTTGKIIALTIQTFVGKVISLFCNILSCHSFSSKE